MSVLISRFILKDEAQLLHLLGKSFDKVDGFARELFISDPR